MDHDWLQSPKIVETSDSTLSLTVFPVPYTLTELWPSHVYGWRQIAKCQGWGSRQANLQPYSFLVSPLMKKSRALCTKTNCNYPRFCRPTNLVVTNQTSMTATKLIQTKPTHKSEQLKPIYDSRESKTKYERQGRLIYRANHLPKQPINWPSLWMRNQIRDRPVNNQQMSLRYPSTHYQTNFQPTVCNRLNFN